MIDKENLKLGVSIGLSIGLFSGWLLSTFDNWGFGLGLIIIFVTSLWGMSEE